MEDYLDYSQVVDEGELRKSYPNGFSLYCSGCKTTFVMDPPLKLDWRVKDEEKAGKKEPVEDPVPAGDA